VGLDVIIDISLEVDGFTLTANEAGATYQWVTCPDYEPISGATDVSYTATEAGSYAAIITLDGGCSDTTECVEVGVDNIAKNESASLKIYPNPTNGLLTIESNLSFNNGILTIVDLGGKVVYNGQIGNTIETINLSHLQTGVYFVQMSTGDKVITKKVTITH
jgi:hypothetical protein